MKIKLKFRRFSKNSREHNNGSLFNLWSLLPHLSTPSAIRLVTLPFLSFSLSKGLGSLGWVC